MPDVSDIVDRLELTIWGSDGRYTISSLKESIESAAGPDSGTDIPDAYDFATTIFDEMSLRKRLLQDAYPFNMDGESVEPISGGDSGTTYLFCVALSVLPSVHISQDIRGAEFETVALKAAENYFVGSGVRTGAPWRNEETPSYDVVLNRIYAVAKELKGPKVAVAPGGGDGGWDVIVARPFPDQKYPQLLVVGNCATGRVDFMMKGNETHQEHFWSTLFWERPRSPVLEFFAVPFVLTDDERSRKTGSRTILFDRFRLTHFCPHAPSAAVTWLNSKKSIATDLPLI